MGPGVLREALEYLTTPCPPLLRRFGYLAEAVALGARHRRQRRAWAPHVDRCRRFVADAAALAPAGGRALVAGSGLLIEVPLDRLAERFAEVVLADVVHARSARRQVARFPNVRLATLDVAGILEPLAAALAAGHPAGHPAGHSLPAPAPPPADCPALGGRFAFAVSCNLLSQLPLLPLEAIGRHAPHIPEEERAAFARTLARSHLEWLAGVAGHAALFTDTESLWLEHGRIVERDDSTWGLTLPPPDRAWDWNIAPAPEEDPTRDLRHSVGAWFEVGGFVR